MLSGWRGVLWSAAAHLWTPTPEAYSRRRSTRFCRVSWVAQRVKATYKSRRAHMASLKINTTLHTHPHRRAREAEDIQEIASHQDHSRAGTHVPRAVSKSHLVSEFVYLKRTFGSPTAFSVVTRYTPAVTPRTALSSHTTQETPQCSEPCMHMFVPGSTPPTPPTHPSTARRWLDVRGSPQS